MFVVTSWDGRIRKDIDLVYRRVLPDEIPFDSYKFFTILPFWHPYDSNGQLPSNYLLYNSYENTSLTINILPWLNLPPVSSDETIQRANRWKKILDEGYGVMTFRNQNDFFSLFSYDTRYNEDDKKKILKLAINFAGEDSVATSIIYLLKYTPITVIFLPYDSNGYSIRTPSAILDDIFEETNFLEEQNFYIELGLRSSGYYNQTQYNIFTNTVKNKIINITQRHDIISVFDAPMNSTQDTLYNSYKIISLAGWQRHDKYLLPPSVFYAYLIKHLENTNKRFASIVNKKTRITSYMKPIAHYSPNFIHNLIDSVINMQSSTNLLTKIRNDVVFLTDVTQEISSNNMLRQENAVRAALYAKKIMLNIGKYFIGLNKNEINYEEIENKINKYLSNEDLNIYCKVLEEDNTLENVLFIRLFIEIGKTIYRIDIKLTAND
ncbi:MAG: hypothetical protein QXF12_04060, partial [Candidatus Aenigmatarchaeota archaeon]